MKTLLGFAAIMLAMVLTAGCSKKANVAVSSDVSVTAITSAKTRSGKLVDAYEVRIAKKPSIILVVGGGKLATSSTCLLSLDGQMLEASPQVINNAVLILTKTQSGFIPIPDVTPDDAMAKCKANIIDLPIDEILSALPPPPGS